MNTFTVSATEAKQNFSEILNRVLYERKTAIIERHGKAVAHLTPSVDSKPKKDLNKVWDKYAGIWPDFPDVKKARYFSKRRFKKFDI